GASSVSELLQILSRSLGGRRAQTRGQSAARPAHFKELTQRCYKVKRGGTYSGVLPLQFFLKTAGLATFSYSPETEAALGCR
ncbi:MAG TPA: hypothetical protein VIF64_09715, partial [Pyrinomonadaceae bacterium]